MHRMEGSRRRSREAGFTLVELLIVVIILGILAAIVVPQFGSSTSDAKLSALDSTLAEMRGAIELYYHQHNGRYPGRYSDTDGTSAPADVAAAAVAFTKQLTQFTDGNGRTQNFADATYKYGPYLKKQALPNNPVDSGATPNALLINSGATVGQIDATGTNAGGWWFDTTSGKFIANVAAYYGR